jgi:hypothetical protein
MARFLNLWIVATALFLTFPGLRAEDAPLVIPAGEPLATLVLPDGFDTGKISIAVSKALVTETWENLGWEGAVTTATTKQSRINIKVFALASASEIKFFAEYSPENKATEEKCRQVALSKVRELERTIATKLNLYFRKAKGDETVDRATTG